MSVGPDSFKSVMNDAVKTMMDMELTKQQGLAALAKQQDFSHEAFVAPKIQFNNELEQLKAQREAEYQASLASGFCERLGKEIEEFDLELDQSEEVALRLVSLGQTITFPVHNIGWHNPSLILFYGELDGQQVKLVQHISQISFLMMRVKRKDPSSPKIPFGFQSAEVRAFTEQAKAAGMNWGDDRWIAVDGTEFDSVGKPISN